MLYYLLSWNVNGIRACFKKGLDSFLMREMPDVIGFQEIKISEKDILKTEFDFSNYTEQWNPAQRPGYSGTAILIKNYENKIKVLSSENGLGMPKFDCEGRVQMIEFKDFYFVNAYFPNSNHALSRLDYKKEFNQAFLNYLQKLEKKKPVIACGDFNVAHQEIDLKNPKENYGSAGFTDIEREWMTKFEKAGFIDSFRALYPQKIQYSWWSYRFLARVKNIGWRIDYFLVSQKILKNVQDSFVLDKITGSDHAPTGIKLII